MKMKKIMTVLITVLFTSMLSFSLSAQNPVAEDCTCKGIPLHGKVKIVENFADFEVKVVTSFPDLKVKQVNAFADDCGEWEFVESFPDFTVKFVESFPDFTIEFVESFPGRD